MYLITLWENNFGACLAIMDVIYIYTTILKYMATQKIYCVLSLTLRTKNFMCLLFKHFPSKFYGQDLYFLLLPYLNNTVTACPLIRLFRWIHYYLHTCTLKWVLTPKSNPQVNLKLKPKSWTYYANQHWNTLQPQKAIMVISIEIIIYCWIIIENVYAA